MRRSPPGQSRSTRPGRRAQFLDPSVLAAARVTPIRTDGARGAVTPRDALRSTSVSGRRISRRNFLASGAVLGAAGCSSSALDSSQAEACSAAGKSSPLAQDYVTVLHVPKDGKDYYIHDPGMALLPSGTIFVAAPCWQVAAFGQVGAVAVQLMTARSQDRGRTWSALPSIPNLSDAAPFVHDGSLYMFVESQQFGSLALVRSDDEGDTWSNPASLFDSDAAFWNCSTPMVEQNGKLYWAVQQGPGFQGDAYVIAADLSKDLLDPSAWQKSTPAKRPLTPWAIVAGSAVPPDASCTSAVPNSSSCPTDAWLEPNIVSVNGKIRVILRTNISDYGTTSLPAVCDLTEDASGMHLSFTQFFPAPGGQNKCFILHDTSTPTGLFWMLSNLPADSQGRVLDWKTIEAEGRFLPGPGNDRRFLMLSYSIDALNWFPAGCVARAGLMRQSFMYPSAAIDGDDLVLISRTSIDGDTQHNADTVTFHRIARFRDLAMNLYPDSLGG